MKESFLNEVQFHVLGMIGDVEFKSIKQALYSHKGSSQLRNKPWQDIWIVATHGDRIIGCNAIAKISSSKARVRYSIVHTDFRGRGVYNKLFELGMEICENAGFSTIDAFATQYSLSTFLRYGFEEQHVKSNITYVKKHL